MARLAGAPNAEGSPIGGGLHHAPQEELQGVARQLGIPVRGRYSEAVNAVSIEHPASQPSLLLLLPSSHSSKSELRTPSPQ